MKGVIAAGHPLTARAGADVLREGGNAVDAAVAAVLMSFVAESPLTGPGAGGFMLVHTASGENHLLDFFVAAPGKGIADPDPAPLVPIDVEFAEDAVQRFNCGPSSCGAYGTTAGLAQALERFGSVALGDLTGARGERGARGRGGDPDARAAVRDPRPDHALDARGGGDLRAGGAARGGRASGCTCPIWPTCSTASAPRGPGFLYDGRRGRGRAATGCSSAAACSRARTWPPTR